MQPSVSPREPNAGNSGNISRRFIPVEILQQALEIFFYLFATAPSTDPDSGTAIRRLIETNAIVRGRQRKRERKKDKMFNNVMFFFSPLQMMESLRRVADTNLRRQRETH